MNTALKVIGGVTGVFFALILLLVIGLYAFKGLAETFIADMPFAFAESFVGHLRKWHNIRKEEPHRRIIEPDNDHHWRRDVG